MQTPCPSLVSVCSFMVLSPGTRGQFWCRVSAVPAMCAVWASDSQIELLLSSEPHRTELFCLSCIECLGLWVWEASRMLAGLGVKATLVSDVHAYSLITLISKEGNVRLLGECLLNQHYCYMISPSFSKSHGYRSPNGTH